jgi:urea transport system permease protein
VALAAVIVVPGVCAALFAWAVFRRRVVGVYFALITQALALCFATLLVSQQESTGGFNGLTDFSTLLASISPQRARCGRSTGSRWRSSLWSFLGLRWLMRSRFGTMLRATRDGENRVRFLGHNPTPYKVVAFTISAMLAGIGGALFTLHAGVVSPALVGVVPFDRDGDLGRGRRARQPVGSRSPARCWSISPRTKFPARCRMRGSMRWGWCSSWW